MATTATSTIRSQHGTRAVDSTSATSDPQSLATVCADIHQRVQLFLEREFEDEQTRLVQSRTKEAMGVIGTALRRHSLQELSLSYNGGKDCLVLLILFVAALHAYRLEAGISPEALPPIQSVYIRAPDPFNEVESFVAASVVTYHLALATYTDSMKRAFGQYLEDYPKVKAILVGTRRTDPHGANLTNFDVTDHGWPKFVRVHPVIDWHYVDIWTFIRHIDVPYCTLYDKGYTSLGGTTDTLPNPRLQLDAGRYRPAYELVQDEEERLGREKGSTQPTNGVPAPTST